MTTNSMFKNSQVPKSPARRRLFLSGFLANISMAWKMGLMAFVLFLGILGITASAYAGMQSLRYQLSNIYDFMLIPIVAINHADTALADTQFHLEQLHAEETTASEQAKGFQDILSNETLAADVMARYDTEWVTTASPEFTQALREAGKLDLQQQEIAALDSFHSSFDGYKAVTARYLATVQAGNPDENLSHDALEKLESARANLQALIVINNEFADFSNAEAQAAFRQALLNGGIVLSIALALGLFMSYLIVVSITSRLGELTRSAAAMQEGNLDQTVAVAGRDEVSLLGATFNKMATQLKELFTTLEQRVADRTKALSSVAEVGTAVSTILETDKLLQEVVDLTKERFDFYHTHIYLLNDAGDTLVLAAGAGEPGRQMVAEGRSIPLDREQSLVARAARERKGVTVNDVTTAPDFLPHPLLPDTRSELAVPMIVGKEVIGVFDVQSEIVGRFTDADVAVQTTLASQVATSVQNARSYMTARDAQQLTRSVIDSTDDWIFIKDQDHRYQLVNQGYANSLHIPIADFIGRNDLELGFPEELVKGNPEKGIRGFWADDRSVMDGGSPKQIPDDLVTIDGNIRVFDTVKIPLRNDDNKVWGVLAFARDMTERRNLEELNRKRAQQQETINLITLRIQSATTIEEAMQVTARELGHALGKRQTLVTLEPTALRGEQEGTGK